MPTTAMIRVRSAFTDDPTQPESRRDGHRHGHPEPAGDRLDVQFVGLDMAQLDLTSKHPMFMAPLTMAAGPIAPIGDGPLIEAEGGDDGLDGTAVAEECDHEGHQIGGFLEPVERGVMSGGEGSAASGASITLFLAAMNGDVAEAELAPCGAVEVVAELALRVHRHFPRDTVWRPCLEESRMDPRLSSPDDLNHGSMGCYLTD